MTKFSYRVKNSLGKTITGTLDAPDSKSVSAILRKEGFFVVNIQQSYTGSLLSLLLSPFQGKIGFSELTTFTRQISVMISAGLTISDSLASLRNQTTNRKLEKLLADLLVSVESGLSFSKALAVHKNVFPDVYVAVVSSGEASGLMDKMLVRLADNLEREREFRGKLKSAFIYPIVILVGVTIVIAIMMFFVIPQLSVLYSQLAVELPLPTRLVLGASDFFVSFWYLIVGIVAVVFFSLSSWRRTAMGKEAFDRFILKVPAWGKLQENANLAEMTRTLGLLFGSGTPIIEALNHVANASGNILFAAAIRRISKKVEKGLSLGSAASQERILPIIVAQMVRVGEESGTLDEIMLKVSTYFESEADRRVRTLTTVLEPIILAVLGIVVGFLMISVIMPIYSITQAI